MSSHGHLDLAESAHDSWEDATTIFHHDLASSPLFTDEALIELLDTSPREHTYALHMGTDLLRPEENRLALHDHLSGAELLQAVKDGRLWLNVTRIHERASAHNDLVGDLYGELATKITGFEPTVTTITVLISSPNAMVYYHVDGNANLLWHIRGHKRIWIYPPEERFVSREHLEDIFASAAHEYVPFDPAFDGEGLSYDLEPGMAASWRPNSPHRVSNGDSFNVSLSTEHYTPAHRTKARVYQANRLLRHRFGRTDLSTDTSGVASIAKQAALAAARRAGKLPTGSKRHEPALRVTLGAPDSVVAL